MASGILNSFIMMLVKLVLISTEVNIWHMIIVPILCMSEFFRNFSTFWMNDNTKSLHWLRVEYKVAKYLPPRDSIYHLWLLFILFWTSVLLLSNLHRKLFYMTWWNRKKQNKSCLVFVFLWVVWLSSWQSVLNLF
jgi:hypothetical protein